MNISQLISAVITVLLVTIYFCLLSIKIDSFQNPIFKTCQMVKEKIFLSDEKIQDWFIDCMIESVKDEIYFNYTVSEKFQKSQAILNELGVSHLRLYNETENHMVWTGESKTNGVVAKYIDGNLVVVEVLQGSSAEKIGIQIGDILLNGLLKASDQLIEMNEFLINSFNGTVNIKRKITNGYKNLMFKLTPTKYKKDEKIKVNIIHLDSDKKSFGFIKIPTFKKEFFEYQEIQEIYEKLKMQENIVLDFRGNLGGNFVAGLRFLSLFNCHPNEIGILTRKSGNGNGKKYLSDILDDEYQIEEIKNSQKIILKTYSNPKCLNSHLAVLIDANTASTAEMVALALREANGAKIFGAGSSGQLLVGIWHDIDHIWKSKIRLVIPEAKYQSKYSGIQIEGSGVSVDENIYDRIQDYQKQKDSWIEFIKSHYTKIFGQSFDPNK